MGRERALIHAATVAMTLALGCACASTGSTTPRSQAPEETAIAWFGVRGTTCDAVLPALGLATSLRAGTVSPWRVVEQGPWCAVAPTEAGLGLRIDSLAQRVSASLALPALSLFVARGAWSYTVFDRGEPVLALESHVGESLFTGDAVRAAGLLEVETAVLSRTAERGRDLAALDVLSDDVGLHDPGEEARIVEAQRHVDPNQVGTHAPDGPPSAERTLARMPAGTWAALPPLGVVLVKAVEQRAKDGVLVPTYIVVHGMTTLDLPVARAEAMGLRPIAAEAVVRKALQLIDDGVEVDDEAYDATRVKGWLDAMGSGQLLGIARVFATLCELKGARRLYQIEDGLLATSREWLAEEIATARHSQVDAIDAHLRRLCE